MYLVHDLKPDRDVAMKVLHPDLGAARGGERFLTEIHTTARLQDITLSPAGLSVVFVQNWRAA